MPMVIKRISGLANRSAFLLVAVVGCIPRVGDPVPDTVPDFVAARFSNPTVIDNPFLPYAPGDTRTYRADTSDGVEEIVIDVLDETRAVQGVECRVVRDRVFLDGILVEDTHDWFAQDDEGNVWYMGEEVDNYEYDSLGNVLNINHEGAWEAGNDTAGLGVIARAGIVMRASPTPGDVYHQEYYPGEAEDMGEVIALNVPITLSDGRTFSCLQTRDFTPLEPSVTEYKYYAPGIGVVVEEIVGGDERVELVSSE